jgi:hypothetical protein
MAIDVSKQAYDAVYQVIQKILGNRDEAASYAEDPKGYLAAQGVTDHDLQGLDIAQIAHQACGELNLPPHVKQAVQDYAGGGGGGGGYTAPPKAPVPGQSPADHLVQHVNYVTHVTYEGDEYITQQLINQENYDYSTHIDNSSQVNLEGKFYGDVDIDTSSVTATGGGVANTGSGDVFAATGDGAVAGYDVSGVATGDGAVAAGGNIHGPVNTGQFTGVQADGDVTNAAVGDGNTIISDIHDSNLNLGGEQTNVQDSHLENSAVGSGAQNTNVNIHADDGSAVAFGDGAKAEGTRTDNYVNAENSNVNIGDGHTDQHLDQSEYNKVEIDAYQSEVTTQTGSGEHTNTDTDIDVNLGLGGGLVREPSTFGTTSDDPADGGV